MTAVMSRAVSLAVFSLLLCTLRASAQETPRPRDLRWTAPPAASARRNPLPDRPDIRAGGARVFIQRCSACHGETGRGTAKAPDLTTSEMQSQSDGALFWKISTGNAFAGMPPFSNLPEAQRWQLVLHLRALSIPH